MEGILLLMLLNHQFPLPNSLTLSEVDDARVANQLLLF
jgi:hypothetical protein